MHEVASHGDLLPGKQCHTDVAGRGLEVACRGGFPESCVQSGTWRGAGDGVVREEGLGDRRGPGQGRRAERRGGKERKRVAGGGWAEARPRGVSWDLEPDLPGREVHGSMQTQ